MDRKIIQKNADALIRIMKVGYQYTLTKLQELATIGTTELCMALLVLIRENKVKQFCSKEGIRYTLIC